MEIEHNDLAPVFIVGHGSSGTSILSRLLRKYLKISFGTESQFIPHYYHRLRRYGDLENDANLRRLVRDILRERWFKRSRKFNGFTTNEHAVLADVRRRTYRGVLDAVFLQLAKHLGMSRWGDKTPEYTNHLDVLGELFPEAKYIHLLRDGRDVAVSVMGRSWGAKNVFTAACEWKQAVDQVDRFLATLPASQACQLTYEQLLIDPVETFRKLIGFLEIHDCQGKLPEALAPGLQQDLMTSNYNKWRTRMSQREHLQFERVAGDTLARHGYETTVPSSAIEPGILEKVYWGCDNAIRKWTYAAYWQDNFYKLKRRSVDLSRAVQGTLDRRLGFRESASPGKRPR